MNSKTFEDILLCFPEYIDPASGGLWWCADPADVLAVKVNAVCLAGLGKWEDVQFCKDWISRFAYVFVASPDQGLVGDVRRHIGWMPIFSADPAQFRGYGSVTELGDACGISAVDRLMYNAKPEPSGGLLNLADVTHRDLSHTPRTLSGLDRLDRATGGFRAGELTVWTGKRGEGKSTFLGQLLIEAIDQGHKVCAYSGELVAARFKDWISVQAAGADCLETLADPDTGADCYLVPATVQTLIDEWWDRKFYLYDIGIASSHDEDSILAEFEYAHRCLGCDVFLVDNIMTARLKGDRDYYRAQSLFTQRLAQFCKANGAHVHLVAHPRKTDRNRPVDDSDDVSGTGDITNLADNVISVRRLTEPGEDGRETELAVLKARERGIRGRIGLCFEPSSRRFFPPAGSPGKKYGWALMRQTAFVDCDEPTPFGE